MVEHWELCWPLPISYGRVMTVGEEPGILQPAFKPGPLTLTGLWDTEVPELITIVLFTVLMLGFWMGSLPMRFIPTGIFLFIGL